MGNEVQDELLKRPEVTKRILNQARIENYVKFK
jgi:hypothetical protein